MQFNVVSSRTFAVFLMCAFVRSFFVLKEFVWLSKCTYDIVCSVVVVVFLSGWKMRWEINEIVCEREMEIEREREIERDVDGKRVGKI